MKYCWRPCKKEKKRLLCIFLTDIYDGLLNYAGRIVRGDGVGA